MLHLSLLFHQNPFSCSEALHAYGRAEQTQLKGATILISV